MTRKRRGAPVSKEERHQAQLEQLTRLRQIERRTIAECAERLQVSERTVKYWLASEPYKETVERLRQEWTDASLTRMADLMSTAFDTLVDVMQRGKSDVARVNAAAKIGDWMGFNTPRESSKPVDDQAERVRLQEILAAAQASRPITTNHIYVGNVEKGGLLPTQLRDEGTPLAQLLRAKGILPPAAGETVATGATGDRDRDGDGDGRVVEGRVVATADGDEPV